MHTKIINGKDIALRIRQGLKEEINKLKVKPILAVILIGHDGPSEIYVRNKQRAAQEVGIESKLYTFDEDVTQQEVENLITSLNQDSSVNGILLQLPVPAKLNAQALLEKIDSKKDVDGFHPLNIGYLQNGDKKAVIAATPKGVLRLLKETGVALKGLNALVIGRSIIVGKPMAMLLLNEDCTVTIAHSATKNLQNLSKNADIIVSACGCAKMIKKEWLKDGAIIIDVGICRDESGKLCGDVDFEDVLGTASHVTPVPNGVGPMTIAMLLENTLEAYLKQRS